MDETKYEKAFNLIINAGNAKSLALMAVEAAREFDFEEAEKNLKEAAKEFHQAHQAQSDMIQGEAKGQSVELNIILVHAQDHLTMATMAQDNAQEFINLYRLVKELQETVNELKGGNGK
ncbi:PTS cellobiose transporter subunit IIA [Lachnospiraceae bacterium oral taxon 500]|nr:PTS cellobiose transporter subunit IIA [Lachnospiraceae bacterium oral taxon 500]